MATTRAKSPIGRLSGQQLVILLNFSLYSVQLFKRNVFVDWSPTEYVRKRRGKVVRGEVSAVSRRATSLVERGLLEQRGNQLALTDEGWSAIIKYFKDPVPELIEAYQNILEIEELVRRRARLIETNKIISDVISGRYQMTWLDDDGRPSSIGVPAEGEREHFVQHTFTTLKLLDIQMGNEQKRLRKLQPQIAACLAERLNLSTS